MAPDAAQPAALRESDLLLDLTAHTVQRGDQPIRLTPSDFELLAAPMAAPGRAFTRLELLEKLQGTAIEGVEHAVNTHIHNLRAKIEPDPSQPHYVEAVFGMGYRFRGE